MKWVYIVTWTVVTMVMRVYNEKKIDEYGIERLNEMNYNYEMIDSVDYKRVFHIRKEALRFVEYAPTEHPIYGTRWTYVSKIKLDSMQIKDAE